MIASLANTYDVHTCQQGSRFGIRSWSEAITSLEMMTGHEVGYVEEDEDEKGHFVVVFKNISVPYATICMRSHV